MLNDEAMDLMLMLMQGGLIDVFDVDRAWLIELRKAVEKYELGNENGEVLKNIDQICAIVKKWLIN